MIRATINGKEDDFEDGMTILAAAKSVGIDIPTLCNDDRLEPVGACRMCLVHVDGAAHDVISCKTPLKDGDLVETNSGEVEQARQWNLRMLAKSYPAAAFEKYPEKHFHAVALDHGLTVKDFAADLNGDRIDDSQVYIRADMSRCINCYACVRICADVQGQFVWHVVGRGEASQITPDSFGAFGDSTCVSCGAC
jgi:formate dehydrogenase major subunit